MIGEYEIYADEHYHARRYLMIGEIMCTNKRREQLHECLIQVRKDFGLCADLEFAFSSFDDNRQNDISFAV
jgi:hypothetical protein